MLENPHLKEGPSSAIGQTCRTRRRPFLYREAVSRSHPIARAVQLSILGQHFSRLPLLRRGCRAEGTVGVPSSPTFSLLAAMIGFSATTSPHLLAVDDDREVLDLLVLYFTKQGFRISTATGGDEMRRQIADETIDLVLLDLGLPGEDGLALTRYLREHWHGAVIIVTGRGDSVDRIVGLELGADDYVTKPFDLRELLARVRSVLRRSAPAEKPLPTATPARDVVVFADFRFDLAARSLHAPDGKSVALTSGEYDLLRAFVLQPNRVLSRDALMSSIHGREAGPFDRAIDMQIGRLRRKLEIDPNQPALIKSVRGAGYLFVPAVERK